MKVDAFLRDLDRLGLAQLHPSFRYGDISEELLHKRPVSKGLHQCGEGSSNNIPFSSRRMRAEAEEGKFHALGDIGRRRGGGEVEGIVIVMVKDHDDTENK
jgi:hypothetical protein